MSKLARQDGAEPRSPANIKQSQDLGEIGAAAPERQNAEHSAKIRANNTKNRAKTAQEKSGKPTRELPAFGRLRVNSTHSHADRGLDTYWTPPEATIALLKIESVPRSVADPACGSGAILDVLRAAGHIVHGSDIVDYGWPHTVVRDYLAGPVEMNGVAIVTNPPYRLAQKFVHKALGDGTRFAAFLLRLNFLESMRRKEFFETHPPSRVWVSSRRLPMMHRLGWTGRKAPSNHCYAWFVWDESREKWGVGFFDWKKGEEKPAAGSEPPRANSLGEDQGQTPPDKRATQTPRKETPMSATAPIEKEQSL